MTSVATSPSSQPVHLRRRRPGWRHFVASSVGLLVACVVSTVAAQSPLGQTKTFLWRVASSTASVHLLGSVHVASPDLYPLDPRIESAFQRAQTLVLETSLDPASQVQAGQKMASAGTYPAGDSIELHLDREILELLQRRLNRSGASFDQMRSFRPWLVAVILTVAEMQRLGYSPALGVDTYFAGKAKDRKRILALETLDEQVALFSGMSDTVQASMLKESLTKLDELGELMQKAQLSWRRGDPKALDDLMVAPMRKDFPDVFQRLFVDRNRRMTTAIEGYLRQTGEYFVVVGSGHLIGPDGILDLLRAKGYLPVQQ
ncbi:MAG TPA: TraB/GumN family protein [Candidatus Methylomirabilis sp.]|nr:TraB/GumN family protein [Candidatus Methylomirabilis sp.]